MGNKPKVTVFMPVYNGEEYLKEAIDSVLSQSFRDFELIIIDDGSTDGTAEIIRSYADPRICFIQNETNLKIAATRNKGLEMANGEYIVLNDADDISYPERLAKLVDFMDKNPEVGICGSWYEKFGEGLEPVIVKYPIEHDEIKANLFFHYALLSGSSISRKKYLDEFNLKYDETYSLINEDHDFLIRGGNCFKLHNFPEVLYRYRQINSSITHTSSMQYRNSFLIPIFKKNLETLGIDPDEEDLRMIYYVNKYEFPVNPDVLSRMEKWLIKLLNANRKRSIYSQKAFAEKIGEVWRVFCWYGTQLGMFTLIKAIKSPLSRHMQMPTKQKISFAVKCVIKYKIQDN